eukprot:gene21175-25435_t
MDGENGTQEAEAHDLRVELENVSSQLSAMRASIVGMEDERCRARLRAAEVEAAAAREQGRIQQLEEAVATFRESAAAKAKMDKEVRGTVGHATDDECHREAEACYGKAEGGCREVEIEVSSREVDPQCVDIEVSSREVDAQCVEIELALKDEELGALNSLVGELEGMLAEQKEEHEAALERLSKAESGSTFQRGEQGGAAGSTVVSPRPPGGAAGSTVSGSKDPG